MGKSEGDAFGAGGDDVNAVTAVVGEGGAKIVGAVPVEVPRKTVVGAVKRKTKLAGGMKGVSGEVIRKTVQTRPGGKGRVGAPRAHNVKVKLAWGRRWSQRSEGKSGWMEAKVEIRWFLLDLTDFSAGLDLCICGGTNCTGSQSLREKILSAL